MTDFYKILGVDKTADEQAIKKAYRKLALKFHPDRNPDNKAAEEKFKEISKAYGVLGDTEKRKNYDTHGSAEAPEFEQYGFDSHRSSGSPFDIFDTFGDIFGARQTGRRQQQPKADNLLVDLHISFKDAIFGCERNIRVPIDTPCHDCGATGDATGSPKRCGDCGGLGRMSQRQGFMLINVTCPACQGHGSIPQTVCMPCGGSGRAPKIQDVNVKIPSGVDTGQKLRVANKGQQAPGAIPGDLIIRIIVSKNPMYRRENMDVHSTEKMSFSIATLGGSINVMTVHGKQTIKIPPGTDVGTTMRLRGKGVPRARTRRAGHHYVHLDIEVPKALTDEQKELIKKLQL